MAKKKKDTTSFDEHLTKRYGKRNRAFCIAIRH